MRETEKTKQKQQAEQRPEAGRDYFNNTNIIRVGADALPSGNVSLLGSFGHSSISGKRTIERLDSDTRLLPVYTYDTSTRTNAALLLLLLRPLLLS